MGVKAFLYIAFAAVIGAQWGGMVSLAYENILLSAGLFLISILLMVGGGLVSAKVFQALNFSPKDARDYGLAVGIVLLGGGLAFGIHSMGGTTKAIGLGAGIVTGLALAMTGYESFVDITRKRVADRVKKDLADGLKATYSYDYEKATEIYENAIITSELGVGSVDTVTIVAVRHLADMYKQRGQFNRCAKLYQRCVSNFEAMPDPPASDYANVLFSMAQMYQEQKDMRSAAYYARRALDVLQFDQGANPLLHVRILKTLASFYAAGNDFNTALQLGEQACEVLDRAGMETQKALLSANLVDFMIRLNRHDEAELKIQELFAERERLGMVEDGVVGQMLLAQARLEQLKGGSGVEKTMEALNVIRRSGGPSFPILPKLIDQCAAILIQGKPQGWVDFLTGLKTGMTNKCLKAIDSDPNLLESQDGSGWRPLQWAVFFGKEVLVEHLFTRGAEVNVGEGDNTPLHIASRWGHTKIMTDLLTRGANVNALDRFGSTPLHGAACSPANRAVDILVAQNAEVDVANQEGYTPLHLAAMNGRTRMIIDLMECQADINVKNPKTGETPLHLSVKMGHRGATEGLLMCGANKNVKDGQGKTPTSLAKSAGRDDLISLLKDH